MRNVTIHIRKMKHHQIMDMNIHIVNQHSTIYRDQLVITYSKGRRETSFHPFVSSSIRPSVSSWSVYSDGMEKEWNTDVTR